MLYTPVGQGHPLAVQYQQILVQRLPGLVQLVVHHREVVGCGQSLLVVDAEMKLPTGQALLVE